MTKDFTLPRTERILSVRLSNDDLLDDEYFRTVAIHQTSELGDELNKFQKASLSAIEFTHKASGLLVLDPLFPEILNNLHRVLESSGGVHITLEGNARYRREMVRVELEKAGLKVVIFDDNNGSVSIVAQKDFSKHTQDLPLPHKTFTRMCEDFKNNFSQKTSVSYVITIHNEQSSLPVMLSFLDNITDLTGIEREFIFVLNCCTDRSQSIVEEYSKNSPHKTKIVISETAGILPAFIDGLHEKSQEGLVGRFDADIILHPYTLDLMQMHLLLNKDIKVTYAEPVTFEAPNPFNEPWHNPGILSKRLYYTGKTSLYRENPFNDAYIKNKPDSLITDDVFTSFYYIYRYGFGSVSRAPHALVYEKVVSSHNELTMQLSRIGSELKRVLNIYPQFKPINNLMEQWIDKDSDYYGLVQHALSKTTYVEDWIRLETTK